MPTSLPRGITPRDRMDRVLILFASEVGPQLRQHPHMMDWPIQVGHQTRLLADLCADPDFVLDAYQCAKMIRDRGHMIFSTIGAKKTSQRLARELLALRNAHAHGEDISSGDVSRGSRVVQDLLKMFGSTEAASLAADLALPPSIGYVAALRVVLIEVAKNNSLITYEQALRALDLPEDDVGHRVLYRQLNVLAAKQLILDEPQLCALVVLPDEQLPGKGFWWVLDLARDDDVSVKRTVHTEAVRQVREYRW